MYAASLYLLQQVSVFEESSEVVLMLCGFNERSLAGGSLHGSDLNLLLMFRMDAGAGVSLHGVTLEAVLVAPE
jgi:hypothetical protein